MTRFRNRRHSINYGMRLTRRRRWFAEAGAADATTPLNDSAPPAENDQEPEALTWDDWYDEQPEDVRGLLEDHTKGLKSALEKERDQAKTLSKQLKGLSGKLEEGSAEREQLEALTSEIEAANARADFYEQASDPAIGLVDAKAAWVLIQADPDTYTRRGKPDFAALKEAHPGLFSQAAPTPRGNAGSGARKPSPTAANPNQAMNDFIRGGG